MAEAHGNLSHAMRDNYDEYGVDEVGRLPLTSTYTQSLLAQYYRKVASSYRNPFFPGIKKVRHRILQRPLAQLGSGHVDVHE